MVAPFLHDMFNYFMEKISGHKDSVTQVAWSHDGTMLATGDMAGLIQVWSVATKEMIWSSEISDLEVILVFWP